MHEEADGLLDPWASRDSRLTWCRGETLINHRPHADEICLADQLLAPAIWPHVSLDLGEGHRQEPLRPNEPFAPLWLTVQIAPQRVLGASRLVRRVDPSDATAAVASCPLSVLVGHVTTLDLDHGHATGRRQKHEIDLDVASLPIAEPQPVNEDLVVLKRRPQRLPDHALRLRLEHRTLWNCPTPASHRKTLQTNQFADRMLSGSPAVPTPVDGGAVLDVKLIWH